MVWAALTPELGLHHATPADKGGQAGWHLSSGVQVLQQVLSLFHWCEESIIGILWRSVAQDIVSLGEITHDSFSGVKDKCVPSKKP